MVQAIATAPIIDGAALALWNEGMMPEMISQKLGYPLDSVEDIIEAPGNYINEEELLKEGR